MGVATCISVRSVARSFPRRKIPFLGGLKTPLSQVWQVLEARTEGMGLNAAVRVFKDAKNTVFAWERTCEDMHQVLLVSSLIQTFLQMVIEGDEASTWSRS